ncbi:hypothetical protein Trydic_g17617 [Trypoxylus dichotomus]
MMRALTTKDNSVPLPGSSNRRATNDIQMKSEKQEIRYTQDWLDSEPESVENGDNENQDFQGPKEHKPPPTVLTEEGELYLKRKEATTNEIDLYACNSGTEKKGQPPQRSASVAKTLGTYTADYRCLRCAEEHPTFECPFKGQEKITNCANCRENHHAASKLCALPPLNLSQKEEREKGEKILRAERKAIWLRKRTP